jgi:hypothetical protein
MSFKHSFVPQLAATQLVSEFQIRAWIDAFCNYNFEPFVSKTAADRVKL